MDSVILLNLFLLFYIFWESLLTNKFLSMYFNKPFHIGLRGQNQIYLVIPVSSKSIFYFYNWVYLL